MADVQPPPARAAHGLMDRPESRAPADHGQLAPHVAQLDLLVGDLGEVALEMQVLVPTERGLARALEKGLRHVAVFGSATETFARRNLNRGLDDQFAMFEPTVARARAPGLDVRAYVSMCFGDPWEGPVAVDQVRGERFDDVVMFWVAEEGD